MSGRPFELSPCINLLFREPPDVPFSERVARATAAGHARVDMWDWRHRDVEGLAAALVDNRVTLSVLSCDLEVNITDPSQHDAFLEAIADSAGEAKRPGCSNVIVSAGETVADVDHRTQTRAVVSALRRAAPIAEQHGVTLLLENLNSRDEDQDGCFLVSTRESLAIVDAVGRASVRMLYDLYHSVMMDEDPSEVLAGSMDRIAYVQIADVPGRHEPGTGKIDWRRELGWLLGAGYAGPLGLEYLPTTDSDESMHHLKSVLRELGV
jgi:hydroxypyruvate isomerase